MDPRLYRLVVEQSRDYAVFVLDPGGRIQSWNLGAQRLKGYQPDEIIGRHFSAFYAPEQVASGWPAHELRVAAQEGRFEDEGWRVRKDGSRFWANVIITALRDPDGTLLGFSKFTRDLTDRRLHEEALRQSEERFRLLVEGVREYAIYMLDPEGIVTSWNAGARRIKGYAADEVLGRHFSRFYPPEEIAANRPWEMLAAARRDGHAESEGWRVRKDGSRFRARMVMTALHDRDGRLRGFAKVTQDLSQQENLRALEKATQNAAEFVAMLAHELRNPLAPIRTAVQVLASPGASEAVREQMRRTIDRQSASLARIVDDLVDISRITRGVLHFERRPTDLVAAARQAIETSTPEFVARGHRFELEAPPMPIVVEGDAQRLVQLLANLLNNAARYTPNGGSLGVRIAVERDHAVVRVWDTGRGIAPELQERIFDMFVQGRSPLERIGGGLGVGLALARRIAETHGGRLTVRSDGQGRGSEFSLQLPLPREARPAPAPRDTAEPAPADAPPRRVLVVDDNADAADSLAHLLRSLGHEVQVAYDGPAALGISGSFQPHVVMLDIGMPGMDGYEVARRLRERDGSRAVRLVAVTGWGQEVDRHRSREAGFDQHVLKPVEAANLRRLLAGRNGATLH